jgi:hypothetical protein
VFLSEIINAETDQVAKQRLLQLYIDLTNKPVNIHYKPESFETYKMFIEDLENDILISMYDTYVIQMEELFKKIISNLNRHNSFIPFNQKLAISNFLKRNVEKVYENIGTLGYATWLTTTDPIDKMAAFSIERMEREAAIDFASELNPADIVQMIFNNTIGRNVIGISASADKAECCIEY